MMRPIQSPELLEVYPGSAITGPAEVTEVSTDTRSLEPGFTYCALRGARFDGHLFNQAAYEAGANLLVVDHPDTLPLPQWIVPNTERALGYLGAFNRHLSSAQVVAITGSNGKTTTKEMLATLLSRCGPTLATQGNLNNAIGVPKTLLRIGPEHAFAVIEMGANHVGEIAYSTRLTQPDITVLLNAGRAHVGEFGSRARIRQAKGEIMQGLSAEGIAILNDDDAGFAQWSALAPGRVLSFGTKPSADIQVTILQSDNQCSLVAVRSADFEHTVCLPMSGQHNVMNLAAAIAVMVALKLPDHLWLPAIADIKPAAGRLVEHQWHQWTLIDDTYNASPESVLAAIEVLAMKPQPRILVLGELRELGSETQSVLREIGQACRHRVDALWTIGSAARYASGTFGRDGRHFDTQAELLAALETELKSAEGGCILMKGSRAAALDALLRDLMEALKLGASHSC